MQVKKEEKNKKDAFLEGLVKPHSLTNIGPFPGSKKVRVRVGRGHAAGKGKQAGRGQSGQKKRSTVRPGFEGGQNP